MSDEVHKLGEVLRAAREAKGVDLARVERDTKIRERYLVALEAGDYRDLPGSVYTKGFLRNYGTYLGLDPEYLIDLYRLETSVASERPRMPAPPRPIATRGSRAFVITPGLVFAAILTVAVGAFVAYIGWEFVNFARTPELRITDPPGPVSGYTETSITVRGETAPNATVTVSNLRENPTVVADADGAFEITVELVPGSNVIELVARDPVTNRDSEPEQRTVVVAADVAASPSPGFALVTLTQPAADATITGPVAIAGTAAPSATLTATAALVTPPSPTFSITDGAGSPVAVQVAAPTPPEPVTLTADATGAFSGSLALPAGTWDVSVTAEDVEPVVRRVTVGPGAGLAGVLDVAGGESYLEVAQDGIPVPDVSGGIAGEGERLELTAANELTIRAGNAGAVHLTINGITIGAMGGDGAVVEWRITRAGG
ncbi:MAG TPA: RodZ domain-containing protein [Candidatus Limnocylindria bacterium]|nr:RodZ domain-containing protein [Candidatus Limnocylindria bacterium]